MEKAALVLSFLFVSACSSVLVFAEDQPMDMGPSEDMQQQRPPHDSQGGSEGMMGGGKMGMMKGGMMKGGGMMQHSSMVATSDGGVIVLSGHKLAKYDSDLNLVKEVQLKMEKGPRPTSKMADQPASQEEPMPPPVEPPTVSDPSVPMEDNAAAEPVWHEANQ